MYVCMYVCMYECMCVCVCVCVCVCAYTQTHTHTNTQYMYVCMYVCMYVYTYIYREREREREEVIVSLPRITTCDREKAKRNKEKEPQCCDWPSWWQKKRKRKKQHTHPWGHSVIVANGHLSHDRIRRITAAVAKDPEHVLDHEPGIAQNKTNSSEHNHTQRAKGLRV